jgi:hypothetical protein
MYGIELGPDARRAAVRLARESIAPKRAAAARGVSKYRRTSDQLVGDVIDLHRQGLVALAISEQLNLSPRRVRQIIRASKAQTRQNGGANPHG